MMWLHSISDFFEAFVFFYPATMTLIWMIGGLYYYFRRESPLKYKMPVLTSYPFISVLIPAHNEETAIESTILGILASNYPEFEVIIVDDGSQDKTREIILRLANNHPQVRGIFLEQNMGKPYALRCGAVAAQGEIIATIDADALLDPSALRWMAWHFITGPRVGAVTGNPRVRNRTSLLAKIQVGEYSTIIGMLKRTQRILGKVLTVSGVIVAFNRRALHDVGYWDIDMITDDINITWKLEKKFWDVRYEPHALCWILVPETVKGLWRQRVRWAQGGGEVIRRHWDVWFSYRQRRIWPVYLEYVTSIIWSYTFILFSFFGLVNLIFHTTLPSISLIPDWKGSILAALSLLQFAVACFIDKRYEKGLWPYLFWVIWYPFAYWFLAALAAVWASPKALFRKMGAPAVWKSPDRGLIKRL